MAQDEYYMKRAVELAKKAEGLTSPNPIVGAVLVKDGRIIGEGYHKKAGLPHAEVEAIKKAGKKCRGATLYVTLEPCSTYGRTPPCTKLIASSGIKKVIIAARDTNPVNKNKGINYLKKNGIEVKIGIMEDEARRMNKVFEKFIREGIPYVTAKIAQSLDGKIATETGESRWITGIDSRRFVHKLRGQVDAVLVGANTIIRDDPLLTNRLYRPAKKQPVKIVLDSRLRISPQSRIFSKESPQKVIIATTAFAPPARRRIFEKRGAKVLVVKTKNKRVSLEELMKKLAKADISHILVEGGSQVLGSFFKEGLIDKVLFFISPKIIGGAKAPTSIMGDGVKQLRYAHTLKDIKVTRFKDDFLIEGYTK